jgi:hypothetical protein
VRSDIPVDHAIVGAVADDDRAVMERLAALEAEVKADADAQRARKAATIAKLRDQRVTSAAHDAPPAPPPRRRVAAVTEDRGEQERGEIDHLENLGGALELASKANRVKQELQRTPGKGDKSWIKSGVASLALGPVGWLYAGSMREAVPATVAWVALAALASKLLPVFLMMPVLMVVLPLSAIAGVVYALQYNRAGARQRLFTDDKAKAKPKQLRRGRDPL